MDDDEKTVAEQVENFLKLVKARSEGCEGFLGTLSCVRAGRVITFFTYENFPRGDFQRVALAILQEVVKLETVRGTDKGRG